MAKVTNAALPPGAISFGGAGSNRPVDVVEALRRSVNFVSLLMETGVLDSRSADHCPESSNFTASLLMPKVASKPTIPGTVLVLAVSGCPGAVCQLNTHIGCLASAGLPCAEAFSYAWLD